jgi:polyisoprenyl-phosphate glycosyltransferase
LIDIQLFNSFYKGSIIKKITIVTPCFNEEDNINKCYLETKKIFDQIYNYNYEHLFIDNASVDSTFEILNKIAKNDKKIKIIRNSRNFGWVRSPYYGLLQADGDGVVMLAADLQDPVDVIPRLIEQWELGGKSIVAVKKNSKESKTMFLIRSLYYKIANSLSDVDFIEHFTGFGLYDKKVIDILRSIKDPYPFFRGMIAEIGLEIRCVEYVQPKRLNGKKKSNFYLLYDVGMLGIVSHSKVPLRIATMAGLMFSVISLFSAIVFFMLKLVFWNTFTIGIAPIIIGLFFLFSILLFSIGIVGEYVGFLYEKIQNKPLVIERNRVNFD